MFDQVKVLPITLLHYPAAHLIYRLKNRLNLPSLIVGSMFPDFEIPLILLLSGYRYNRLVLHSFFGAATLGTILSVLFTISLYPVLAKTFFKVKKESVKARTNLSVNLFISCLFGNVSHVLLDILTHPSNPIFWPLQTTTVNPTYTSQLSLLVHIFSAALLPIVLIINRRNTWEKLLIR